jgi:hypothetical protein
MILKIFSRECLAKINIDVFAKTAASFFENF